MIKNLLIKNYALIRHLQMEPASFFNTITGETGAGKSIMLGAVGLLLGKRADTRVLFHNNEKCIIEGTFDVSRQDLESLFIDNDLDYSRECIIRREISPAGKSRAFINDTPVTLDVMKNIGTYLVDVHSQRDTLLLGSPSYQLNIIDAFAENQDVLIIYRTCYKDYKNKQHELDQLRKNAEEIRKEADYNHFLYEELKDANFNENEQEGLEEELQIKEHAEEIKNRLVESTGILSEDELAILNRLQTVSKNIDQVAGYAEHFIPLKERIHSCFLELQDISREIENEENKLEFDPSKLEEIQERLSLIYRLQQKHGVRDISELLHIQSELAQKVNRVSNLDEELSNAERSFEEALKQVEESARVLKDSREKIFGELKSQLEALLKDLGMPHATIEIVNNPVSPTSMGTDDIKILFSANVGVKPDELKNVASGGEFSRLMFAVKYVLAAKTELPTIIFDEIDSGVSGEVALKMVSMMSAMSKNHQVVAITHLPQIAARGDAHFYVFKEQVEKRTVSKIKQLSAEERVIEIAKMIGGDTPSDVAQQNAAELLQGK
jgi:DNA repair protein RecN (Recombination protein N)